MKAHESSKSLYWYEDEQGNTYVCDRYETDGRSELSRADIERACIDEQDKPWND